MHTVHTIHTYFFSFSSYGDHPDLHSFPTRRSSDLRSVRPLRKTHATTRPDSPSVDSLKSAQDRKSTRLNSSHMSISYAVFCLKKKKSYNYQLLLERTHVTSNTQTIADCTRHTLITD